MLENIEQTKGTVIVDFWAPWCGPCRMLSPVLDEIQQENKDVKIIKINVDENQELVEKYNIQNVPTLVVYRNGKQIKRMSGFIDKKSVINIINSTL